MARYELIENPYGIMYTGGVVRVVTRKDMSGKLHLGDRTHVADRKKGGTLCGAGRDSSGKEIPGAILRGPGGPKKLAKKVEKREVDCLRCIKILYMDTDTKGVSGAKRLLGRSFRASALNKRDGHNMIIGGRAGENIGRRPARGDRADKQAMVARGYAEDEITAFGPHKIASFRRGSDMHPTQTRYAPKVAPAAKPSRELTEKQVRAQQAMRLFRAGRAETLKEAYELYDEMVAGGGRTLVANPRRKKAGARRDSSGRFVKSKKR